MADLFTDDGVFLPDGKREVAGREALATFFANLKNAAHPFIHNHVVAIDGDTAKSTCYIDNRLGDGTTMGGGSYEDEFRRTAQGWKFTRRCHLPAWRFTFEAQAKQDAALQHGRG